MEKLDIKMSHPPAQRLLQMLRTAKPTRSSSIRSTLNEITLACNLCKEFHSSPFRFRAALSPDKVIFNHELAMDLMLIDGNPVLNVVDTHTGYQNAVFIDENTSDNLWDHFLLCWATVYVGYPNRIRLEQETSFKSEEFRSAAAL